VKESRQHKAIKNAEEETGFQLQDNKAFWHACSSISQPLESSEAMIMTLSE